MGCFGEFEKLRRLCVRLRASVSFGFVGLSPILGLLTLFLVCSTGY